MRSEVRHAKCSRHRPSCLSSSHLHDPPGKMSTRPSYIPRPALQHLKSYSYKSVDKCAYLLSFCSSSLLKIFCLAAVAQVDNVKVHSEPVLESVCQAVADHGRSQHCAHNPIRCVANALLSGDCRSRSSDCVPCSLILRRYFTSTRAISVITAAQLVHQIGCTIHGPRVCSSTKAWMPLMGAFGRRVLSRDLTTPRSKQARRTGMAGPLGEMFDHGAFTSRRSCFGRTERAGPGRQSLTRINFCSRTFVVFQAAMHSILP